MAEDQQAKQPRGLETKGMRVQKALGIRLPHLQDAGGARQFLSPRTSLDREVVGPVYDS